jgi:hypothetical protein
MEVASARGRPVSARGVEEHQVDGAGGQPAKGPRGVALDDHPEGLHVAAVHPAHQLDLAVAQAPGLAEFEEGLRVEGEQQQRSHQCSGKIAPTGFEVLTWGGARRRATVASPRRPPQAVP